MAYTRSLSAVAPVPMPVGVPADRDDAPITVAAEVDTNQDPAIAYLYFDAPALQPLVVRGPDGHWSVSERIVGM